MNFVKYFRLAAAAAAILLTGCGTKNSVIKQYESYLAYSLGADGKLEYNGPNENGYDTYGLSYRDQNGNMHETDKDRFLASSYEESKQDEPDLTEETYNFEVMLSIVNSAVRDRIIEEVREQVLKPCFPDYDRIEEGKDSEVSLLSVIPRVVIMYSNADGEKDTEELPRFRQWLEPDKGLQLCKTDLKSVACDPEWFVIVQCVLKENADADKYIGSMQKAVSEFRERTGSPQNYLFYLQQKGKDGEQSTYKILFSEIGILGEKNDSFDLNKQKPAAVLKEWEEQLRKKRAAT